jgi:hypothetical protein
VWCNRCRTNLPDGSDFCPKCGRRVFSTIDSVALAPAPGSKLARAQRLRAKQRRRVVPWLLVLVVLGAVVWAATSERPSARQVQELVGWSHAQTIVDAAVAVDPRGFSAFEFTVPPGALDVRVAGDFSAAAASLRNTNSKETRKDLDTGIEAFVLTDAALVVWRSGYSTQTQYESGPAVSATIDAALPAGAGVYHLVFSNKTSPRAKTVRANVLLRYKSWLPNAVVRLKERFWNWIGP